MEDVKDDVFSQKILGDGCAIEPSEDRVYSPCDGRIDAVFDTKHAVNIISDDGAQILIHIGIDTVKLGGKCFDANISDNQRVQKGDLLISFDSKKIKQLGFGITIPVVVCNSGDYGKVSVVGKGSVKHGDELITIE
ncbi:MAG: PTS glucose transporter subunit IIA [Clostridiales bacterium]|nr:PTS glucose transporter subunit IIA [Clostridiales bacterium]